jgi:hypothetical protein
MNADKDPCPPIVPLSTVEFVDRTIAAEREVLRAELAARDKAMDIQTKELSRRLDELNHAHQRAQQDKQEFLNKTTYEAFLAIFTPWQSKVSDFMANSQGRTAAYVSIVVVIGILINIALRFWK